LNSEGWNLAYVMRVWNNKEEEQCLKCFLEKDLTSIINRFFFFSKLLTNGV